MRIGFGFDAHKLAEGRKLVLGGVEIPHERGLLGHSDADVLVHAIADALLGAAGLGDIGRLFPDTDPQYKDARSLDLLIRIHEQVSLLGFHVVNADTTVVCEAPRIGPHVNAMRDSLARALDVSPQEISIKGKTTEKMGFTGRGEGIAAFATVLIEQSPTTGDSESNAQ
jgi:2-C-methyl-D-erythritol 2,4-cyclodiphosphate synthase